VDDEVNDTGPEVEETEAVRRRRTVLKQTVI